SRRRHTRFSRDWSSDVCSSDLPCPLSRTPGVLTFRELHSMPVRSTIAGSLPKPRWLASPDRLWATWGIEALEEAADDVDATTARSEERRVGNEMSAARAPSRSH